MKADKNTARRAAPRENDLSRRSARVKAPPAATATTPADDETAWSLRLYVAGQTPRSLAAFANLKKLCEQHLPGRYRIEVIDLTRRPELAQADQIVALPTLVRKVPAPLKRIIGDLSDFDRVAAGMGLRPKDRGREARDGRE